MKKLYKKLMKTSALICLLILGTGNAWGEATWNGYKSKTKITANISTTYTNFITGLQMKADNNISYSNQSGGQTNVGIEVKSTNKLYFKPTTDGFLSLRFTQTKPGTGSNSWDYLTIVIQDITDSNNPVTVESVEVSTVVVKTTVSGEFAKFEVIANHEYKIVSSTDNIHNWNKTYYVTSIAMVPANEILELSDEIDASSMQTIINNNTKKHVKFLRTLKGGKWNTFCSPIAIVKGNITSVLKCAEVYKLKGYDPDNNTMTFEEEKNTNNDIDLQANTPYLIKPSEDVVNPTIFNQKPNNNPTYNPQTVTKGTVTKGQVSFIGVLGAENIYTNDHSKFYLNTEGNLVYPTNPNNSTIKGLRAYFQLASGVSVKDLNFVFDDSETTGIKTIEHDIFGENGRVYSIDGRYMGDSTDNLSRGIYIQNGRKFVVK